MGELAAYGVAGGEGMVGGTRMGKGDVWVLVLGRGGGRGRGEVGRRRRAMDGGFWVVGWAFVVGSEWDSRQRKMGWTLGSGEVMERTN